jgi:hypothetical protein
MPICITIEGKRHCFPVPLLVDSSAIRRPHPNNLPPFELAATVLELVRVVGPSDLSSQLSEVALRYIKGLQAQLPEGVEITPGT